MSLPARGALLAVCAILACVLLSPVETRAQWATPTPPASSNDITNTNTGNVGIGTSTPNQKLHVIGSINAEGALCLQNDCRYTWSSVAGTPSQWSNGIGGTNIYFLSGNVGIGTNFLQQRLNVQGMLGLYPQTFSQPSVRGLFMYHGGTGGNIYAYNYPSNTPDPISVSGASLDFNTYVSGSAQTRMMITNGGSIGIGTTTPSYKLDVAGQIRSSSGGFVFPDGTTQTTAATGGSSGVTSIAAGNGLTGGGTGATTLNVGAGTGLTVGADDISVNYGATAGTAVQGNTSITLTAGSGMTGGGAITLGSGGSVTLTNNDKGSAQNIFKNITNAAGATQFSAGSNSDALGFEGTGGTTVSFNAAAKRIVINSADDKGSAQNIFKNITNAAGATQFSAGSNSDALSFEGTGGTTVSFNAAAKRIVINSSATVASGWTEASGGATLSTTNTSARVGIGTASPAEMLDINGTGEVKARAVGTVSGAIQLRETTGATTWSEWQQIYDRFRLNTHDGTTTRADVMTILPNGNIGIGKATPTESLDVVGNIRATGSVSATYQDVAEWVPASQKLTGGTVVVLDGGKTNHVTASTTAYDTKVAGVVSDQPGIILGVGGEDKVKVATTGRVKVKVDASRGAIKVGDLLVTSEMEGVAMKSEPMTLGQRQFHAPGTIIGKALEPLEKGTGEILVLLSLQ